MVGDLLICFCSVDAATTITNWELFENGGVRTQTLTRSSALKIVFSG